MECLLADSQNSLDNIAVSWDCSQYMRLAKYSNRTYRSLLCIRGQGITPHYESTMEEEQNE